MVNVGVGWMVVLHLDGSPEFVEVKIRKRMQKVIPEQDPSISHPRDGDV